MTIAVVTLGEGNKGPDKNILPNHPGIISWINGDTESLPIDVRGFRSLGIIDPSGLTGPTEWVIFVAATKDGLYAPLNTDAFAAGTLKAFGTIFIADWNFAKVVPNATVTAPGDMPFNLT